MTDDTPHVTRVSMDELADMSGFDLGRGHWLTIDQKRIDTFADAANDDQWIHTDPARAASGPFGVTIAHGYLTLALVIPLFEEMIDVSGVKHKINYGLNKVRFPAPVEVDSKVRLAARLGDVTPLGGSGLQFTFEGVIEVDGRDKPALVAEPVFRFYR